MKNKLFKLLSLTLVGLGSFIGVSSIVKAESWTAGNYINVDGATKYDAAKYFLYKDTDGRDFHNPSIMKMDDGKYVFCIETDQDRGTGTTSYTKTEISQNDTYKANADKFRYALNFLNEHGFSDSQIDAIFVGKTSYDYTGVDRNYTTNTGTFSDAQRRDLTAAQMVFWPGAVPVTNDNKTIDGKSVGITNTSVDTTYKSAFKDKTLTKPASYGVTYNVSSKKATYDEKNKVYNASIVFTTTKIGYMGLTTPTCKSGTTNGTVTASGSTYTCNIKLNDLEDTVTLSTTGTKVPEVYVYTNDTYQDFVGLETGDADVETEEVDFDAKTVVLKITKGDRDGKLLKDVEFELYDSNDEKVGTCTTDEKGYCEIEGLVEGDYTLKETKTPEGYVKLKDEVITITKSDLDAGELEIPVINDKIVIEKDESNCNTSDKNVVLIATIGILAGTSAFVFRKKIGFVK